MTEDAPAGGEAAEPGLARAAVEEMIGAGLLDRVMSQAESGELALTGEGGFLPEMVKAVLERGLAAELTGHLGYDKGDPNRGVRDVLIVCCDGLTGFPDAIEATWPLATVQTCTVHLIRSSMRFISYGDRRAVAAALRPVYTAPTAESARMELEAFAASDLGRRCPATVQAWERAWDRFIPFLEFPPAVRKIIYTTNAIESLNYQLRKIIKNRGHFPGDDAVIKLLWLAIRDIEDKRARDRAREKHDGVPHDKRRPPARLVEGATVHGWKQALGALSLHSPDRLSPYIR